MINKQFYRVDNQNLNPVSLINLWCDYSAGVARYFYQESTVRQQNNLLDNVNPKKKKKGRVEQIMTCRKRSTLLFINIS